MPTKNRLRYGKGLVVAVVGAAALAVLGYAAYKYLFNRPGEAAAALIPADAHVVVTLDTNPSDRQLATFTEITNELQSRGIAEKLDKAITGFLDGKPIGQEIRPHLQRSFAMGMWMKDGGSPDVLTLCAIDNPPAVKEALEKHGTSKADGIFLIPGTGDQLFGTVTDSYLALSNTQATLSRLEKVKSGSEANVTTNAEFAAARQALPEDANLMVFVAPKLFETLEKEMKDAGGTATMGLGAFKTTKWMAYSATIVPEGIAFDYQCPLDANKMPVLKQMGAVKAFDLASLKMLPEGAYGVMTYSQAGRYWSVLEETVKEDETAAKGFEDGLGDFERETGLDVETDVVPAFQGDQILAVYPGKSGKIEDVEGLLVISDANGADPAALAAKVRALIERKSAEEGKPIKMVETTVGDATIWEVSPESRDELMSSVPSEHSTRVYPTEPPAGLEMPSESAVPSHVPPMPPAPSGPPDFLKNKTLAYAQVGKSVVMSSSRELLEKAIQASGKTLADDPAIEAMRPHIVDGSQGILLVNLKKIMEALRPMIEKDPPPFEKDLVLGLFGDGMVGLVVSGKYDGQISSGRILLPLDFKRAIGLMAEAMESGGPGPAMSAPPGVPTDVPPDDALQMTTPPGGMQAPTGVDPGGGS